MQKIDKEFYKNHFRVAIFGSARLQKDDPRYNQIYNLARMIGEEGMDVVTGGGPGLMEAANRGHQIGSKKSKNGAHSIGLSIRLPREQADNRHLDVKKEFRRFSQRLDQFMRLSNVMVVAPGGIGTLLELAYTWQLTQVEHICDTPIILLGKMWPDFIQWVNKWPLKQKLLSPEDVNPIFLADNCKQAMKAIRAAHAAFQKGGVDFCLNYKKYRLD